jgi:hypothetical protein
MIHGLTNTSHKPNDRSIGGNVMMLGNKNNDRVSPLYWKSKTIKKVCHSAKVAETQSMLDLTDTAQFTATQLEQMLFRKYEQRIPVKLHTDSRPMLESIGSHIRLKRSNSEME